MWLGSKMSYVFEIKQKKCILMLDHCPRYKAVQTSNFKFKN